MLIFVLTYMVLNTQLPSYTVIKERLIFSDKISRYVQSRMYISSMNLYSQPIVLLKQHSDRYKMWSEHVRIIKKNTGQNRLVTLELDIHVLRPDKRT